MESELPSIKILKSMAPKIDPCGVSTFHIIRKGTNDTNRRGPNGKEATKPINITTGI
jgi:hypothetical protein